MMMEHLRVVIADNESIIRMDMKEILEEAGLDPDEYDF